MGEGGEGKGGNDAAIQKNVATNGKSVRMSMSRRMVRFLVLSCVLIVLLQTFIVSLGRLKPESDPWGDYRALVRTTAVSLKCTISDNGKGLRVGPSRLHGNGVFACEPFKRGDVVEVCPLLRVPTMSQLALTWYYFRESRDEAKGTLALALGYGSLYNHSASPNAVAFFPTDENRVMIIHATTEINVDDEILIDYGPNYWILARQLNSERPKLSASAS